jgi:hypothetical protein
MSNSRLHHRNSTGPLRDNNGNLVTPDADRAEVLNQYYCSTTVADDLNLRTIQQRASKDTYLDSATFTETMTINTITKLKAEMTCDLEGFAPYLLKQLCSSIAHTPVTDSVLVHVYQQNSFGLETRHYDINKQERVAV